MGQNMISVIDRIPDQTRLGLDKLHCTVKRENLVQTYFSTQKAGDLLAQTYFSAFPIFK